MANVTRYDPFGELFDDFFKGYFVRPVGGDSRTTAPRLTVDVTEQNGAFKVLAEIPGVKKDDIRVTIDGDQVTIRAETKQEKDVKDGERLVHSERYFGKVSRSFRLGYEIDQARRRGEVQRRGAGARPAEEAKRGVEADHDPVTTQAAREGPARRPSLPRFTFRAGVRRPAHGPQPVTCSRSRRVRSRRSIVSSSSRPCWAAATACRSSRGASTIRSRSARLWRRNASATSRAS